MQLKKSKGLALALTQASAALLGTAAPLARAAEDNSSWVVDTAALYYAEDDSRVQAAEPVVNLRKDYGDEHILNLKAVIDSLTGASPNGAATANVDQVFTGPSGGKQYTTPAGSLPLDGEFKDTRVAFSGSWQQPIADATRMTVGGNVSSEFDFMSVGVNGALAHDFNNKNTTLSAGLNLEFDSIKPVGGAPLPFSRMDDDAATNKAGDDTRNQYDLVIGLTQILGRHSLLQLNYGLSSSSGYHTDPYKILSVLDASDNLVVDPSTTYYQYLFESRPDSRMRHSLYAQWKYIFTDDVIDLSARYTTDDWGVNSQTLEAKYYWTLGNHWYLEPHVRLYSQTAADFYKPYLKDGVDVQVVAPDDIRALVQHASADPRLAEFDATTIGLKVGYLLGRDSELSLRAEQYDQKANSPAAPASGDLAGQTMTPDTSAMMVQLGYSFRW